jgi:hypothetical protein
MQHITHAPAQFIKDSDWVGFPGGELEGKRPKVLCPGCRQLLQERAAGSQPCRDAVRPRHRRGCRSVCRWLASRPTTRQCQACDTSPSRARKGSRRARRAPQGVQDAEAQGCATRFRRSAPTRSRPTTRRSSLAETRLREARTEAAADIDARKKAIEDLLAPMAKTLEQVDREIKDSERRRVENRRAADAEDRARSTPPARTCATRRAAWSTRSSGPASAAAGASSS